MTNEKYNAYLKVTINYIKPINPRNQAPIKLNDQSIIPTGCNNVSTNNPSIIEPIELEPNASKFAIFSAVRATVLESDAKVAQLLGGSHDPTVRSTTTAPSTCCVQCAATCKKSGAVIECRCHSGSTATLVGSRPKAHIDMNNESDNESFTDDTATVDKDLSTTKIQVPQIVDAGLRSLFELIVEARSLSPTICSKALRALFNVIQGQVPEAFRSEPSDLIQALYDLLLDLATSSDPNRDSPDSWSAIGCSTLLALCVARGDTGKTLRAVAALLMSPNAAAHQSIQLPLVLSTLQRSIISVALGHPTKPDYLRNGVPQRSLIGQFGVDVDLAVSTSTQPSLASAGKFVFLLTGKSLLKIGTGFGGTLPGYVYARNDSLEKEKNGWIGISGVSANVDC